MSVTGMFNTTQLATTPNLVQNSFASMITRLMPNGNAPLFGITSQLESETAVQVQHGFYTKTMLFPELRNTTAAIAGDTTIEVASTTNALPGQVYRVNTTGENIIINTVVDATHVTVTRGVGTVAAGSIADETPLYLVGNAYEEGSTRPNALNNQPVQITNLTQIFRNTWALTGTTAATQVIVGDTNVAESKQDCAAWHATAIETALIFGQKSSGTRNGQPFRTMDGLISITGNIAYYPASYSAANVSTAGATTNYTQLEAMLDPVFNQTTDPKGARERVLFTGGTGLKVLNNIGRLNGTYQLVDGQTSYGLQFTTFKTTRGTFRMIEHPLFNTNPTWSKMAVVLDLTTFKVAYLGDRKTQNKEFNMEGGTAQDNGIDAVGGTLTTEMTCVIKNPPANAVIHNLTAAAAG
jgi:hypothetical protein